MVIVIVGPTAVGKTKLSILLAKKYNGEVINADSTQIYKELDIATAKVTFSEMEGVVHHLLDIKDICEDYSVFDFQKDCRRLIDDIKSRGKTPIIVGGTGLYVKAALYDYQFSTNIKEYDFSIYSNQELYDEIMKYNSNTNVHVNNRKRLENVLSHYRNGDIISNKGSDLLYNDCIFIGLTTSRDVLYERINKRVDLMVQNGLILEARNLYERNIRSKAVMTPIGYKELFMYFDNLMNYDKCLELIKKRSRHYAKRQYTWFNNQMNVVWFDVDFDCFNNTVNNIINYIDKI